MLELTRAHTPRGAQYEDQPVFRSVAYLLGLPDGTATPGAVIAPITYAEHLDVTYGGDLVLPAAVTRHLGQPRRLPSPYDPPADQS